jgi:hypothetical protein
MDGMLLAPGTPALPVGLRYAYVADGSNGTPLVANGFKYNSKESSAPKKFGGMIHAAPLPSFWVCNPTSLLYEQMDETGQVMASSVPRPPPNKISSRRSLGDVQRLRREYELAAIQVVGKEDSDSYLSLVGVEARDKEFNLMWGFPESRRWLAARKEVAVPNVGGDGQWRLGHQPWLSQEWPVWGCLWAVSTGHDSGSSWVAVSSFLFCSKPFQPRNFSHGARGGSKILHNRDKCGLRRHHNYLPNSSWA